MKVKVTKNFEVFPGVSLDTEKVYDAEYAYEHADWQATDKINLKLEEFECGFLFERGEYIIVEE